MIARTVIARRVYIRRPALLIAGIESPARAALVRALGSLARSLRAVRRSL